MAGNRYVPVASPKQEAVDGNNPQPNETWHASEFNDMATLLNRRDNTRTFSSTISFNDHYDNGTYNMSSGDLTLTIDSVGAKSGFTTIFRVIGNDTNQIFFGGAGWYKYINIEDGEIISGEQIIEIRWTAHGAIVEQIVTSGRSISLDYSWTSGQGQTDFTIPSARANEISEYTYVTVNNVIQTSGFSIVNGAVSRDTIRFTSGLVAGDKVAIRYKYSSDSLGGGSVPDTITKVAEYQNLGAFNPTSVDLGQSGYYNDYTLSGNLSITTFTNGFNGVMQSVKMTFAGESLTIPSGVRFMNQTLMTITPDAGDYELYMYYTGNLAHTALVPYVTSGVPTLTTPVITVVPDDGQNTLTLSAIDGNATGGVLEFHDGDLIWAAVPTWTFPTSPIVHSSLVNGTEYFYRFKVTAAGYNDSAYGTNSGTPTSGTVQLTALTLGTPVAGDGQVTIPFTNPNSNNETVNQLYYKLTSEPTVWMAGVTAATGATTFPSQTGLTNGLSYDFRAVAEGDGVTYTDSDDSNIVSATPLVFNPANLSPDYFNETPQTFNGATSVNTGIYNTPFTKNYWHVFIQLSPDDGWTPDVEVVFGARRTDDSNASRINSSLNTNGRMLLADGAASLGFTGVVWADGPGQSKVIRFSKDLTNVTCYADGVQEWQEAIGSVTEQLVYPIHWGANNAQGTIGSYYNGGSKAIFIWGGDTNLTSQNLTDLQDYFDAL